MRAKKDRTLTVDTPLGPVVKVTIKQGDDSDQYRVERQDGKVVWYKCGTDHSCHVVTRGTTVLFCTCEAGYHRRVCKHRDATKLMLQKNWLRQLTHSDNM